MLHREKQGKLEVLCELSRSERKGQNRKTCAIVVKATRRIASLGRNSITFTPVVVDASLRNARGLFRVAFSTKRRIPDGMQIRHFTELLRYVYIFGEIFMPRITFPCPNQTCPKEWDVEEKHVGKTVDCPVCKKPVTVPTVAAIALNRELDQIEAVINEFEEKIKDGRHSVATVKQRIQAIARPDEIAAKFKAGDREWIEAYTKEINRVGECGTITRDIHRLYELKSKHPNDSRIIPLGYRAVDCYMKLSEIKLTAGGMNSDQKRKMLEENEEMMSHVFPRSKG